MWIRMEVQAKMLARQPLRWTQNAEWVQLLKIGIARLLDDKRANNSQAKAIATAAMQRMTLWQVLFYKARPSQCNIHHIVLY